MLVALQNLVMYTLLFELPQVLAAVLAVDAAAVGRLLVSMMGAMIVASLLSGRLVDRIGPRPIAVAGTVACLGAVGLLASVGLSSPGRLVLPLALLGLGVGLATPAAQSASLAAVPGARSGAAAGIGSTMRYLGGVVGVALLGRLVHLDGDPAAVVGRAPDRPRRVRGSARGRADLRSRPAAPVEVARTGSGSRRRDRVKWAQRPKPTVVAPFGRVSPGRVVLRRLSPG